MGGVDPQQCILSPVAAPLVYLPIPQRWGGADGRCRARELLSTLMDGDFTVDEIVAAIKRVGAGKQLATSRNVATELERLDHTAGDKASVG